MRSVLVIDDDKRDVELLREAFAAAGLDVALTVAGDGLAALAALQQGARDSTLPDIILLDLNMPRMDGFELLAVLKQDADLRLVPVVVLTTSDRRDDMQRAILLHANAYVVKPRAFSEFAATVTSVHDFWLRTAALPLRGGIASPRQ